MSRVLHPIVIFIVLLSIGTFLRAWDIHAQSFGSIDAGFGLALTSIRQAESAGATQAQISQLVTDLNEALNLKIQAQRPSSSNESRAAMLAHVDQLLNDVRMRADTVQASASQTTLKNRVVTYALGAIAAIIVTFVYSSLRKIWSAYRIKRTMQMRVIVK